MEDVPITQVSVPGDATAPPATAPPRPGTRPFRPLGARLPLRILAADDVRISRELLRQLTAYFGYQAEVVENGVEVIEALRKGPCDLVLLDVQMPVMDGLEAAREIVRLFPDPGQRPKMVALTANSLASERDTCMAAGMDDCIVKPISPRAFESCVVRLFTGVPSVQSASPLPSTATEPVELPLVDFMHLEVAFPGFPREQLVAIQQRMHHAVIADFETIWPRLMEAVSKNDQDSLAESLHALKGCFSTLGWNRIAGRCAAALQRARAQQFSEWSTLPDELQQLYAASTVEMERHLAAAPASATSVKDQAETNR